MTPRTLMSRAQAGPGWSLERVKRHCWFCGSGFAKRVRACQDVLCLCVCLCVCGTRGRVYIFAHAYRERRDVVAARCPLVFCSSRHQPRHPLASSRYQVFR